MSTEHERPNTPWCSRPCTDGCAIDMSTGPLDGIRVIELAGLGALPFGSLKLADMGAQVVRVERPTDVPADRTPRRHSAWDRGRRSIAVDLKNAEGVETVLRLAAAADVFLESFRPG